MWVCMYCTYLASWYEYASSMKVPAGSMQLLEVFLSLYA